jgi:RNA polymerase sigma-70 factor (sigma-E family)
MIATVMDTADQSSAEARRRDDVILVLFDQQYTRLRGLAYVMLGDSGLAEEVVMEAFAKVFSIWPAFRRTENPAAYLRQVVVNISRGKLRRRKVEWRVGAVFHGRSQSRAPDWEASRSDADIDVWRAVGTLPERQRACVALRYLEDMTEREIAEAMDCSVGTVKSQLSRARRRLAELLDAPGGND